MSPQLSLVYRPAHLAGEQWKLEVEALRAAVAYLGLKEVAFELDVSGSSISDALNERDRKRWAGEWTQVVQAMLSARTDDLAADLSRGILEAQLALTNYEPQPRQKLTPEQLAAALRDELLEMGAAGKRALDRVTRKGLR
jgi:hypothetical protein